MVKVGTIVHYKLHLKKVVS